MKLTAAALVASLVVQTGCATVFAPGPDRVPVTSKPPGANIFIDGALVGQTPSVIELDRRRSSGRIRIEAPGYHPVVMLRKKGFQGWFWCNLCFFNVIGFVIDLATLNARSFDGEPVIVTLVPTEGAPMEQRPLEPYAPR